MSSTYWLPFSRSHTCGDLSADDAGTTVRLMGWVARARKLGGLRFIDLRDRDGIVQLMVDPKDADLDDSLPRLDATQDRFGAQFVVHTDRIRPGSFVNGLMR